LSIGQPGDKYEEEADKVADQVMQKQSETPAFFTPKQVENIQQKPIAETVTPLIQKQEEEEEAQPKLIQRVEEGEVQTKMEVQRQEEEEEEMLQTQPLEEEEELLQPKVQQGDLKTNSSTEQALKASKGNGSPLNSETRVEMEQGFGADFTDVKIHTNSSAVQMNKELRAQAFTSGNDIYFNEGRYRPESKNGKKLLAHELTHTVQQGASTSHGTIQKWPWSRTTEEQIAEFRGRNYGPITYTRNEISGSGFQAVYYPQQNRLNITVRGKVRFADTMVNSGGTYSSPNHFMNQSGFTTIMNNLPASVQSAILPYFQWTDEEKQIHMLRFKQNLLAAASLWQDTGMSFQVNETGWEGVTASPRVNINITQGTAQHRTRSGGFLNLFTVTDESTSDHLQVEIVKQPTASEVANIQQIITTHNAATGATVTGGMLQGVRSYLGNDPGSRGTAPQAFNNFMSLESNRSDDPSDYSYFTDAPFGHNESNLSGDTRAHLDTFFSDSMILLDNSGRDVDVELEGYASAPGTSAYNRSLVEKRLNSVENYIADKMTSSNINANVLGINRTNDSDQSAENDLAVNPTMHDPANYRKVDIAVKREGRGGQNVLAHELGHVFGLGDEYAEVGSGYNRPAGSRATHDQLSRDAGVTGGAIVGDDNRMMSTGNEVGAAHYSTFADALNQLTSKRWKIVTS